MRTGWKFGAQPRRLLTFALDGKATLPPSAPPDLTVKPVDDPSIKISDEDVKAGRAVYMNCMVCHGIDLVSGGNAPDLRESEIALRLESLWSVVHDGALMQNGMPRFDNLTRDQVRALHAYIRAGAREALGPHKPKVSESMATGR
jgi:quinohemoprotein ethanol dehydrogenase